MDKELPGRKDAVSFAAQIDFQNFIKRGALFPVIEKNPVQSRVKSQPSDFLAAFKSGQISQSAGIIKLLSPVPAGFRLDILSRQMPPLL